MSKRATRQKSATTPPKPAPALRQERLSGFLERRAGVLVIALIALASLRIAATYTVFNHVYDEPAHLACGMEWLDKGVYRWEPQHPPLARVAAALGPYLSGIRSQGTPPTKDLAMFEEGANILYAGHHYDRTLALARLGILPFFWIACAAVYWWGRRYFTRAAAVAAVFLFTWLPPVVAHASLATTDMALTAFLIAAFVAALAWAEEPTTKRALAFGALAGLMVLSKFSCFAFFPVAVALALAGYFVLQRPRAADLLRALRQRVPTFGLACLVGFFTIWAGYRFSFGKVSFAPFPLPFPELFAGIDQVRRHMEHGHPSFLLGAVSDHGFWNFYLVGLAYKSPLGFLALLAMGLPVLLWKRRLTPQLWMPLAFAAAVLGVGMSNSVNIGIRHVLPIYAALSLVAAAGALRLLELGRARVWLWGVMGALVLWMAASSAVSHPDYLAYFNELAGDHPENILVDSDLDWGQDLKRLSVRLHELGVTRLTWRGFIWAKLRAEHGFPTLYNMDPDRPGEGWNAASATPWKQRGLVRWADKVEPRERVGRSVFLWYFPPAQ